MCATSVLRVLIVCVVVCFGCGWLFSLLCVVCATSVLRVLIVCVVCVAGVVGCFHCFVLCVLLASCVF